MKGRSQVVIRQLRLWSGLLFAAYVTVHLGNHALGLVSLPLMERVGEAIAAFLDSPVLLLLLYGSLTSHYLLALWGLYQRRNLRFRFWEGLQLGLGLLVPLLLAGHIAGTRGMRELFDIQVSYPQVLTILWTQPALGIRQAVVLAVVWIHLVVGLHYWLRIKPWYPKLLPWLYPLAVLLPVLALLGYLRGGLSVLALIDTPGWLAQTMAPLQQLDPTQVRLRESLQPLAWTVAGGLLLLTLLARQSRHLLRNHYGSFRLTLPGGRLVRAPLGTTVLEALRGARIPHASVCGGRGRCTTCRIRVETGLEALEPAAATEAAALQRIGAPENVRLACQTRPRHDLRIVPLLPATATSQVAQRAGGVGGREMQVAVLFLDLRGSTGLGERLLPYDVVFILNRFFAEMSEALRLTDGHYAQFNGDGLMALYGLDSDLQSGCRAAIDGAVEMLRRLQQINDGCRLDIGGDLRMGIGIHAGEAIVGRMGPPQAPIVSALGDNVNIAARLESLSKTYDCPLVISAVTARHAGVDLSGFEVHSAAVKGRDQPIEVYAVDDPARIGALSSYADRLNR